MNSPALHKGDGSAGAVSPSLVHTDGVFESLFRHSPDAIWLYDPQARALIDCNHAAVELMGAASKEEFLPSSAEEVSPEIQHDGVRSTDKIAEVIGMVEKNKGHHFEWTIRRRDGREVPVEVTATAVLIGGRSIYIVISRGITERKKAERELRELNESLERRVCERTGALAESEARFNIAFQASPVFISIFRARDETYVLGNDALLHWLGAPREEVLGRTSGQLGMWENAAEREAVWRDLRTIGSIRQRECRWRNRRGELYTVLLSAETITIDHEPHVLSLVLDISQRKNAEVEMLNALAREKELSQLKSNFVSMVSHEFRTPLGIIQSSAELLSDFLQKMAPEERQTQLESIFRNTRRMAGMMEEILVLSRLDAGKLDFQPACMDLAAFCGQAVDEVLSATGRLCPIELSVAPGLPSALADERLLSHILTNLLSNAVKYSKPGVAVRFDVARKGTEALLIISDQGIGISENDQQMLFNAFHRGANVGSRPGTGLGLLLVKRCVELHHGKVRIESKIGAGTTVVVRLPVFQARY